MNADHLLLLHAALDGELDVAGAIEVERMLAADEELAAEYARLLALRGVFRRHAPPKAAPEGLRARVLALGADESAQRASRAPPSWRAFGASIAATAMLTAGLQYALLTARAPDPAFQAVVANHMRGQISSQPFDVASTDRHTVKPWLAGKAPVAAVVVDLAAEGFPLAGGRVDIIEGAAAPTLVYRRRDHFVSLTELPAKGHGFPTTPARHMQDGYPVATWTEGGHAYMAVSDLAPTELDAFVEAFRRVAAKEQGAGRGG